MTSEIKFLILMLSNENLFKAFNVTKLVQIAGKISANSADY
jgi:hypothetical protein